MSSIPTSALVFMIVVLGLLGVWQTNDIMHLENTVQDQDERIQELEQQISDYDPDTVMSQIISADIENACGVYSPTADMIIVRTDNGCPNVEFTVLHEYAHYLMFQRMPYEDIEWWHETYMLENNTQSEVSTFRNYTYKNHYEYYADYYAYNHEITTLPISTGKYRSEAVVRYD